MELKLNKWTVLIGLSLVPTIVGYLLNTLVASGQVERFLLFLMSVLFYMFWMYGGYKTTKHFKSDWKSISLAHAVGFLSLVFISMQVSSGLDLLGLLPQLYFLPGLYFITQIDVMHLMSNLLVICTVELILMVIAYYIGSLIYIKTLRTERNNLQTRRKR